MVNSKVNSRGVVGTNLDETSAAMDAAEYDEDGYRSSEDEDFDPSKEPEAGDDDELERPSKTKRSSANSVPPRLKHILPTPSTAFSKEREDEDTHHNQSHEEEEIEKKSKIDAIWAQLNAGTTPKPTSAETTAPRRITPSQPSNTSVSTAQGLRKEEKEVGGDKVDVRAAAKAALQALKQQEDGLAPGQVYVKEMRRFAGQKVELQKAVEAGSTELEEGLNKKRKTSNLGSVLEQLGAGKKITVVDKSRYDWEGYKKDEKLDEELDTYKKSSNKYLDKVHFLKEAEYKEYERERDMKLKSDVRNRGRL